MSVYSVRPIGSGAPVAAYDGGDSPRHFAGRMPPRQLLIRTGVQMGKPLRHSAERIAELDERDREMQQHAIPRRVVHNGQTPGHSPPTRPPHGDYSAAKSQVVGMGGVLRRVSPSRRTLQIRSASTSRYHLSKVKERLRPRDELEDAEKRTAQEEAAYKAFKKRNFHVL